MEIKRTDILKLGVFFIGIAFLIIAANFVYWTFKIERHELENYFWAYCSDRYVVITARETLQNVKVIDVSENKTLCEFQKITENSEEVCFTNMTENETKILKVVSGDRSKIVRCYPEIPIHGMG